MLEGHHLASDCSFQVPTFQQPHSLTSDCCWTFLASSNRAWENAQPARTDAGVGLLADGSDELGRAGDELNRVSSPADRFYNCTAGHRSWGRDERKQWFVEPPAQDTPEHEKPTLVPWPPRTPASCLGRKVATALCTHALNGLTQPTPLVTLVFPKAYLLKTS